MERMRIVPLPKSWGLFVQNSKARPALDFIHSKSSNETAQNSKMLKTVNTCHAAHAIANLYRPHLPSHLTHVMWRGAWAQWSSRSENGWRRAQRA
eukprot:2196041-Prymnesium_polylepis.4